MNAQGSIDGLGYFKINPCAGNGKSLIKTKTLFVLDKLNGFQGGVFHGLIQISI
jgi:hypothetical protein